MARYALVRGGIAMLMSLGLAVGAVSFSTNAIANVPSEVVIPATYPTTVPSGSLLYSGNAWDADGAGATGVFHTEEGLAGPQWTRYSDGESFSVPAATVADVVRTSGTGTDTLAHYSSAAAQVELRDMATGTTRTVIIPDELTYVRTYASTVVTLLAIL